MRCLGCTSHISSAQYWLVATVLDRAERVCIIAGRSLGHKATSRPRVFMLEHSHQLVYIFDVNGAPLNVVLLRGAQANLWPC